MKRRRWLVAGSVLMGLLGLARGAGGVMLLTKGSETDPAIVAVGAAVFVVGAALALLGSALIASAIGVFRGGRFSWRAGIVCTIAFVVDGVINGYVLYGRPGDWGAVVNAAAAGVILACLFAGRGALRNEANR